MAKWLTLQYAASTSPPPMGASSLCRRRRVREAVWTVSGWWHVHLTLVVTTIPTWHCISMGSHCKVRKKWGLIVGEQALLGLLSWYPLIMYRQTSNIRAPNPKTSKFHMSSCSGLCPVHWSQVLSREWRCSWSSADRWCSNYIWVINNFILVRCGIYYRYDGSQVCNSFEEWVPVDENCKVA